MLPPFALTQKKIFSFCHSPFSYPLLTIPTGPTGPAGTGVLWQQLQVDATSGVYFTIENLGTVPDGGDMYMHSFVGAFFDGGGGVAQAGLVDISGFCIRQPGAPASAPSYSPISKGTATLPGWSTGVRYNISGNDVILEGRVTITQTIQIRWYTESDTTP